VRALEVYRNGELAGILTQENTTSYTFRYADKWFADPLKPPISLTLPKSVQQYASAHLFPFFSNILAEGVNRKLQSRWLKIDEADDFGLLAATAQYNTIGAITVKPIEKSGS
jgi:HipA-like protein